MQRILPFVNPAGAVNCKIVDVDIRLHDLLTRDDVYRNHVEIIY